MNIRINLLLLILAVFIPLLSQAKKITVSGYVQNSKTSEVIIGANVYHSQTLQGTSTNNFGYFAINLPEGEVELTISFVGYTPLSFSARLKNDTVVTFLLEEGKMLDEVNVSSQHVQRASSSPVTLTSQQIRLLPNMTGEADLLKAFQFLPGIAQGAEGNNSLYVRGGSPDQNLILLDDVPLYYVNHIGGLVSIFDEYSVSDITVYKSGFPARYGGRLSSVVDVRLKNGKMDRLGGEISVGLISSKLSLEGPIIKDKISFMLSVRKSMTDFYMRPISKRTMLNNDGYMFYSFYDFNGKINYKISDKDRLYLSFYQGTDQVKLSVGYDSEEDISSGTDENEAFLYKNESVNGWGNSMGCIRWNHLYNQKLFSNLTLAASKYFFENRSLNEITIKETNQNSETFLYDFNSGVFDRLAKIDFDYFPSNTHHIRLGGMANFHRFKTGKLHQLYHVNTETLADSAMRNNYLAEIDTIYGSEPMNTTEASGYIEDEIKINSVLSANGGLHYAWYHSGDKNFSSIQPRFSMRLSLKNKLSFNVSYVQMVQFIHMLTGSDTSMPTDIWVPSTDEAKPETSEQFSAGFSKDLTTGGIRVSTEIFYKTMEGLIDYQSGATLVGGNKAWYDKIETGGKAEVYGAEFLFEKTKGKLTGWISYTLSKNMRQFENINQGNKYPYVYDRPHDLSVVANYKLNNKVSFSGTWEYRSGRRMTMGAACYDSNILKNSAELKTKPKHWESDLYRHVLSEWSYETATIYGTKNNYKLPDFHKLCINAHFTKQKKRGTRIFTIGINNVYNQKNAYNIYYETNDDGTISLKKMTLFPIMPSFSYCFKF